MKYVGQFIVSKNAIISASRKDMLGATLYLVGVNKRTGEYVR